MCAPVTARELVRPATSQGSRIRYSRASWPSILPYYLSVPEHAARRQQRAEDMIIEFSDGRVVGIEVKAAAAPGPEDARHLRWLRDSIGDRFAAGAVLHTGPQPFRLDDTILALPVYSLWSC